MFSYDKLRLNSYLTGYINAKDNQYLKLLYHDFYIEC